MVVVATTAPQWDSTDNKTALSGPRFLSMRTELPSHLLMSDGATSTTLPQSMIKLIEPDEKVSFREVEVMHRSVALTVIEPSARLQQSDTFLSVKSYRRQKVA